MCILNVVDFCGKSAEFLIKMELKADISLSALKFFTSESEHICRLCFSSTEQQEVSFEDTVRLQRSYLDETLTFVDMFRELGVSI